MKVADLLPLPAGLVAVTGDEGTGKTTLLRQLAALPGLDALWLDLALPGQDDLTPHEAWSGLRDGRPGWDHALQEELAEALGLAPHLGKKLFMLSTGSRRKVGLIGALAGGAAVTCLDQPFAAVDMASIRVLRDFLNEASGHATRTWVIADYEADPLLHWRHRVALP